MYIRITQFMIVSWPVVAAVIPRNGVVHVTPLPLASAHTWVEQQICCDWKSTLEPHSKAIKVCNYYSHGARHRNWNNFSINFSFAIFLGNNDCYNCCSMYIIFCGYLVRVVIQKMFSFTLFTIYYNYNNLIFVYKFYLSKFYIIDLNVILM